jgi:hypothetical protein
MTVNFPGGGTAPPEPLGSRRADVPAVANNNNNNTENQLELRSAPRAEEVNLDVASERRFQQVERAAQQFFNDVFAVSDTTFSIYKDVSGQYITRFTSLRDGSVRYIPEPNLLQYLESRSSPGSGAIVQIDA